MTMSDSEKPLTRAEQRVVAAVLAAPASSQEDLAEVLKLSTRHLRRLLHRERVRKVLDAAAREGLRAGGSLLGRAGERAAATLVKMAEGTTRATGPRVAACRAVLEGASRIFDLVELEDRIAALEQTRGKPTAQGPYQ
jgi:hypothetical protein